jgi:hypothetical protein
LTLDNHYFPTADEDDPLMYAPVEVKESTPKRYNAETQITRHIRYINLYCVNKVKSFLKKNISYRVFYREQTPAYNALDVSLLPSEEVQHLRRQVGKLNRRVMALELDTLHRQQRDKILYIATVAYFILKAFSWLTRN